MSTSLRTIPRWLAACLRPLLQMPPVRRVHQIFFNFDGRALQDHPLFARSHDAFRGMRGWTYRLWDESSIEHLCKSKYSSLWSAYRRLKFPIQRVDLAKYMVLDTFGGVYADLDVLPKLHVGEIVGDRPYLCLLYTSPSPRDATLSRMPSSA